MSLTGWLITSNAGTAVLLRTAMLQEEVAEFKERAEEGSGEKEAVLLLLLLVVVVVSWRC